MRDPSVIVRVPFGRVVTQAFRRNALCIVYNLRLGDETHFCNDVVPEYPEEAVREAITNALCHRSYTDVGTIQVRIHDDRPEVWDTSA